MPDNVGAVGYLVLTVDLSSRPVSASQWRSASGKRGRLSLWELHGKHRCRTEDSGTHASDALDKEPGSGWQVPGLVEGYAAA